MKINRSKRINDLLLHPALLALPVALLIILIVPDIFDKYSVLPVNEKIIRSGLVMEYADLDHDGISEYYTASESGKGGSSIVVHNQLGPLYQWNFNGKYLFGRPQVIVGDFNSNNHDELYTFTLKGDSLLLNGIDYRHYENLIISDRFIATCPRLNGEVDFHFIPIGMEELNGDGFKELIFAVSAGYSLSPRRVFAFDVANDSLFFSPELGGHIGPFDVRDIDGDNLAEIAITNYGPGNIKDKSLPMQDTCAYVIVLDNNLNFLFPPIVSPGRYNGITNRFLYSDGRYYIASYWGYNTQLSGKPVLYIYNTDGNQLLKRRFPNEERTKKNSMRVISFKDGLEYIILAGQLEKMQLFDHRLNPLKINLPETGSGELLLFDFDQDGEDELLFESVKPGEWIILRNTFKHPATFKTHLSVDFPHIFTVKRGSDKPQFSFQLDNQLYRFEYAINPVYYWKYPAYAGVYLLVLIFILLIRNLQRLQLRKKYETERKMAELQLLSLRNQMDPHFTFNVLNTIGAAILQNKNEESYSLLLKFSKMIRTTVSSSDQICRSLQEELDFVKNYLDLQLIRCNDCFKFTINVDQHIDPLQPLPKMILQTYVENALKHGLIPKKSGGLLKISAVNENGRIILTIEDNGVGRQQAQINGTLSTGVGLKIMRQYYELLNRNNQFHITEEFSDLYDENGQAVGTRVVIGIPEGYVFAGSSLRSD